MHRTIESLSLHWLKHRKCKLLRNLKKMSNYNCTQESFFLKGTSTGILIRDDNHLNSKYFFIVFNF